MKRKRPQSSWLQDAWSSSPWELKIPIALLAFGLVILIGGAFVAGSSRPEETLLAIALLLVISVPFTIAAMYVTASLLGMGFGYLYTAIVKLAAISVFTMAVTQMSAWLGQPAVGWLASLAISFWLFSYFFDLDMRETILAVVVINIVQFFIGEVLRALLGNLMMVLG